MSQDLNYKHFIITQFNLRNFPKSENNEYEKWVNWTRNRIILFKKYCLPSVLNQSEKDFTWLLYLDSETPQEFLGFIDEMNEYPNIEVFLCSGAEGFQNHYMDAAYQKIDKDTRWIVTSRMDNDDAVHRNMVKIIQQELEFKHGYLVSLASGYVFDESRKKMAHYFYPMSPFLTIVEDSKVAKGIFEKGHTIWPNLRLRIYKEIWVEWFSKKSRMVRFVLCQPLWLQVVHQTNVSNSFFRGLPVVRSKSLENFGMDLETTPSKWAETSKYINYVYWKRYFKSTIVKFLLKH
ncbi:putative rhamnosyl transferase [Bacteroidia bacterium]|nr:putative rhamnosyl transferase [Bacteroidia bacterium]